LNLFNVDEKGRIVPAGLNGKHIPWKSPNLTPFIPTRYLKEF